MLYKAKVAVCSEIHAKQMNATRASRRVFQYYTWSYVKLPLGFKRLMSISHPRLDLQVVSSIVIPWVNHKSG
jgi:hypothetical protein